MQAEMAYLSVEQFELIRRLRNSGIERDELLSAFDQFDEIERTFGDIYSIPVSKTNTQYNTPVSNRNIINKVRTKRAAETVHATGNLPPKRVERNFASLEENGNLPVNSMNSNNINNNLKQKNSSQPSNPSPLPSSVSDVMLPHFSRNGLTISAVSTPSTAHNQTSPNEESNWGSANITKLKKSDDIKSEDEMLAEIRKFLIKYSLKLSTISEMANLPASHVRNYVHGNLGIIPEEIKQRIYSWYEASKINPPGGQSDSDAHFKRERFIFRAVHNRILEENFKMDAYPDNHKREFIAEECNRTYAEELGIQTVEPRDRLNISLVSNWFNNRRKDTRRPIKRGPHPNSNLMENNQMMKLSDGYEGMTSPPSLETQDVKPNIAEMIQTSSSINTPPSYSSAEDDSYMTQKNDPFIPIQNIKQEPPDN